MAIPKKGLRPIVVDGENYFWLAKGNDGYIDLIICDSTRRGQILGAGFRYHQTLVHAEHGGYRIVPGSQFVITPAVVEEVIIYGLARGWTPHKKAVALGLGFLDENIEAVNQFLAAKPSTYFEQPVFL